MRMGLEERNMEGTVPNDESNCILKAVARTLWIPERRHGTARGIYHRLGEDDRFSGARILAEAPWSLNTLISGGGFSAY